MWGGNLPYAPPPSLPEPPVNSTAFAAVGVDKNRWNVFITRLLFAPDGDHCGVEWRRPFSLSQFPQLQGIQGLCVPYRVGKSRLKLNLCQSVAFLNLIRFKPAYINKSRRKFKINERAIQAKSKPSIINTRMRISQYHHSAYCVESEKISHRVGWTQNLSSSTGKLHPVAARHMRQLRVGFSDLVFGENKLKLHIIFENIKEQVLRQVDVNGFYYCHD